MPARDGFTALELLVVVGIITALLAILLPVVSRARASARSVHCLSTVRQIGLALHLYADNNRQHLPDPAYCDKSWEQMIRPYYSGSFACRADLEVAPTVGSSYDWRDTGQPLTTLAGRITGDIRRHDAVMVFEALPGWHAKRKMNACLVDGSAVTLTDDACVADLSIPLATGGTGGADGR